MSITAKQWHNAKKHKKEWIYACYAAHLTMGNTILSTAIKTVTIKAYLKAAGAQTVHYITEKGKIKTFPEDVKAVLAEYDRWMSVPNRREPLTKAICKNIIALKKRFGADSKEAALADWIILGFYAGFRKSEWTQDHADFKRTKTFATNIDRSSRAFQANDFVFQYVKQKKSTNKRGTSCESNYLRLTWRFQKNGQNGQVVDFAKKYEEPDLCPVQAARNIIERAHRLTLPAHFPVAVYKNKNNDTCFLTNRHTEELLQRSAKETYPSLTESALKLFTCHSIRVGACVQLHAAGMSSHDIKHRLRWRSDTFLMYLRNVPMIAARHNAAISNTDTDNLHITAKQAL